MTLWHQLVISLPPELPYLTLLPLLTTHVFNGPTTPIVPLRVASFCRAIWSRYRHVPFSLHFRRSPLTVSDFSNPAHNFTRSAHTMGDQSDTAEPPQPPPRPLRAARRTSMQSSLPKKATGPSSASTQAGQSRRPSAASPAPTGSSEETEAGADTQPSGAKILPDSMTSAGSVLQESSTPLRKVGTTITL